MRLVPLDPVRRHIPNIEAVNVRAVKELIDPVDVSRRGRGHERKPDLSEHLGLRALDDAGEREKKFPNRKFLIE